MTRFRPASVLGILIALLTTRIGSAQVGACCLPDGSCELVPDIEACEILGGAWRGEGAACDDDACSEGACCLTDGTCVIALDYWHCNNFSDAYWQGGGSSCADIVCNESACCLPDGSCLVTNNYYQCIDMGGFPIPRIRLRGLLSRRSQRRRPRRVR